MADYAFGPGTVTHEQLAAQLSAVPEISLGDGAPSSTPKKVGDLYVDTNGYLYFAKGTTNSGDWVLLALPA